MDRCNKCKKFSNVVFKCKCGHIYCPFHLLPEKHSCDKLYDFHRNAHENNEKFVNECSVEHVKFVKLN